MNSRKTETHSKEKKIEINEEDVQKAAKNGYYLNISKLDKGGKPKPAPLSGAKNRWKKDINKDFIFVGEPLYIAGHKTDVEKYVETLGEEYGNVEEILAGAYTNTNTLEGDEKFEDFNSEIKKHKEALKQSKQEGGDKQTEKMRKVEDRRQLLSKINDIARDIGDANYCFMTKTKVEIPVKKNAKKAAAKKGEPKVKKSPESLLKRISDAEKEGKVLNISNIGENGTAIKTVVPAKKPKSNVQVGSLPVIVSVNKPESVEIFLSLLQKEDVNGEIDVQTLREQYEENLQSMRAKTESEPKKQTTVSTKQETPQSPKKVSTSTSKTLSAPKPPASNVSSSSQPLKQPIRQSKAPTNLSKKSIVTRTGSSNAPKSP